jgi:hypothetical protein
LSTLPVQEREHLHHKARKSDFFVVHSNYPIVAQGCVSRLCLDFQVSVFATSPADIAAAFAAPNKGGFHLCLV